MKKQICKREVGAGDVPLIIADSDDEASLKNMVARADVVLTTTGLISMEKVCSKPAPKRERIMWIAVSRLVYDMIGKYQDTASKSGARLVFAVALTLCF